MSGRNFGHVQDDNCNFFLEISGLQFSSKAPFSGKKSSTPPNKEGQHLELLGHKVYSGVTVGFRIANNQLIPQVLAVISLGQNCKLHGIPTQGQEDSCLSFRKADISCP